MTGPAANTSGWTTARLTGRLTIAEAEDRRADFVTLLSRTASLELDTGGLEAVDAAGLQLLIALRRSAVAKGKAVRLAAPPDGAALVALVAAGLCESGGIAAADEFWLGRV